MALKTLELKWKSALFSILEHLEEHEFQKLLFNLSKIPQSVKSNKNRAEIPKIIIQYYGTEGSITATDKEMRQIPRMDADVQDLLRPFVEKLKKQRQKNKGTAGNSASGLGSVAKRQKVEVDQQKSCQPAMIDPAGPSKPKQRKPKKKTDLPVIPAGATTNSQIDPAGPSKPKQRKPKKKTDLPVIPAGATTNSQIDPAGPSKPKQRKPKKKTDLPVIPAGATTNSQIDPAGPSKPKQRKPKKKTDLPVIPAGATTNSQIDPAGPSKPKQRKPKKKTDLPVIPAGATTNSQIDPAGPSKPKQRKPKKKTDLPVIPAGATTNSQIDPAGPSNQKTDVPVMPAGYTTNSESVFMQGQCAAFQTGRTEDTVRNVFIQHPKFVQPSFDDQFWANFWS